MTLSERYLSILVVTRPVVAANARGESHANTQCLQTVNFMGENHTVANGVSLKYAIRASMEDQAETMPDFPIYRHRDSTELTSSGYTYGPDKNPSKMEVLPSSQDEYGDLSMFGDMIKPPKKNQEEEGETEGVTKSDDSDEKPVKKGKKPHKSRAKKAERNAKGERIFLATLRVSPAISSTPFLGDTGFVRGLKPDGGTNPFTFDRHVTRYVFSVNFDLARIAKMNPIAHKAFHLALNSLRSLQVGGSQASNGSEWMPAMMAWRCHNTPGFGGMYMPGNQLVDNSGQINKGALDHQAKDLGFEYLGAGDIFGKHIATALDEIWTSCAQKMGIEAPK